MSININRYVSATTGVIGASAVTQRELVHLRLTTDPHVPVGSVVTVDSVGASALFGANAAETAFANQYFSYISPAPASQAKRLRYAAYVPNARAAQIFGAKQAFNLNTLKAITAGALSLTLGVATSNLTLNFSAATSLADVATAIQTAIRAVTANGANWTGATVSYDATNQQFVLTGGAVGAAPVSIADGTTATALGWNSTAAIYSPGSAAQTPLQAFQAAEQITDSFGSVSSQSVLALADATPLAQYISAQNVKYILLLSVDLTTYSSFFAAFASTASVGLILNTKAGEYKESLPAAIMAATDYTRRNAVVNYMFRQGPFASPYDVTDDATADLLDAARVNYYGETSSAGQKLAFFQRGYLCGPVTAPIDMNVHANEQWLKSAISADILSAFLTLGEIPANLDGAGIVRNLVMNRINDAKSNGTISIGKTLTVLQQVAITQASGNALAWRDVQTGGFWLGVTIIQRVVNGITEFIAQYTLVYSKNDVVRKVEGSHNLV